ncbi:MAG TPA: cytochrome P450 [Polyangiaceae bacterium]|nr:cytochrome P450 [Polyangiaceae bacterium]
MSQTLPIPIASGFALSHLLQFKNRRLDWQMRLMNEHGPICRVRLGPVSVILVSSADYAQTILVERAAEFVKGRGLQFTRPLLGNGLLTSEKAFHKRQRRLISPGFQHRRVATYADTMASYCESAQASFRDGETLDVADAMMKLTLAIAGKTMFDADLAGEESELGRALTVANKHAIGQIAAALPIPLHWPWPGNGKVRKAIARLDETVYRMIGKRRKSGDDPGDVLSMLLGAEEEGTGEKMSDVEVRDEAMTLFLAGHETTANALAWTFYLLSRHPDCYERLRAEVDGALGGRTPTMNDLPRLPYTMRVFKEAMRLYPPAYIIGREAEREIAVGSHIIPPNVQIFVNIFGMHRNPSYFPNPEQFDPDRFQPEAEKQMVRSSYMPFSNGPRVCIGNQFALLEGHIVLAALASRVTFEATSDGVIEPEPLITLRPRGGVSLRVRRRSSVPESRRPGLLRAAAN